MKKEIQIIKNKTSKSLDDLSFEKIDEIKKIEAKLEKLKIPKKVNKSVCQSCFIRHLFLSVQNA